ncbi:MAG: polysaccharide biosynthesis tyrosine autokinase [Pyrinomonadaceae bacterium]
MTKEEEARVEDYAAVLEHGLSVEQVPDTNLVNLKFQNPNKELAVKVSNAVADVFIKQDADREVQGSKQIYADLNAYIDKLKNDIAQKEQERIAYMKEKNLPLQQEGEKLAASTLETMSTQWLAAEDERRKSQSLYEAAVQASQRGELPAVLPDNKIIQEIQSEARRRRADLDAQIQKIQDQILDAESKLSQLRVRYTDEVPEVKAVIAQIEKLKADKAKAESEGLKKVEAEDARTKSDADKQILTVLQAQLAAAKKSEAQAYDLYMKESYAAGIQGQDASRLTTLTREIETSRTILDGYTQKKQEQELAISRDRPDNVYVSSEAENSMLVGPNRNRNILIAFLVSLAAGVGLAFLFDYLDDSIKTSDDVGRYLGLPTLALIPHHSTVKKTKGALTSNNGSATSKALVTLEDNRSPTAEAYRHLRTSLLFSSAGKPPQAILVTSSQPSEGKTTTAINTAITLAQSGAEVVIIDCDLRRPRLHTHFDLDNTTGLTNYLSGDKHPENLLKTYPGIPNLKILTSGPIPPNPAELLTSNEMKNLLQFLKGNYKHVIIDSPPAISFTDAAILATLVDGVVLVAMAGKSSIHLMRRFKQRLAGIGARIYGVVINGIKPNSAEYGYYGYGYTYSYYDAPEDDTTPRMEEKYEVHTTER